MTEGSDFSIRTTPTFMDGALLVANAIADSLLIYRGSSCIEEHAQDFFFPHDWGHRLFTNRRLGGLVLTMDPDSSSVAGTQDGVERSVEWALETRQVGVVLLSELARYAIMNEDLAMSAAQLGRRFDLPCVAAVSQTVDRDYTHAVHSLLLGLAEEVATRCPPGFRADTVAVVGLVRSRNEGDGDGDVQELERMVSGLGLDLSSLWLSGGTWSELSAASEAATIVSLPFGRAAAARLSAHTGAPHVEATLPVSLAGSEAWVRKLGAATGREERAEAFVRAELSRVVPLLDRAVTHRLRGRRAMVVATADWMGGVVRCLTEDLGLEVAVAVQRDRPASVTVRDGDAAVCHRDPGVESLRALVCQARDEGGLDVIIGSFWERSALGSMAADLPFVEFGYPQRRSHFLSPTPHLGFQGVVTWAQRLADAVS